MNAIFLWIIIPVLAAGLTLLINRQQHIVIIGGIVSAILALTAAFIPVDLALRFGPFSYKITSSLQILGRSLTLGQEDQTGLGIIYGLLAFWFFGSGVAQVSRRLVPFGLVITSLLVASFAVDPFLYAALLIEMAVLLSIPLLVPFGKPVSRGVIRFLIYQTLAMPFILFAGWLLPGVEASPGDLALAIQSTIMLSLGFAFLFSVFPLYSWIPMLSEDNHPYIVSFILWILPTIAMLFVLGFLDRYSWLRNSETIPQALRIAGLIMVVTGGIWAAFQNHLGRMLGYAAIVETGFYLLALSLLPETGVEIAFRLTIPRALTMAIWALSLSVLQSKAGSLNLLHLKGIARSYPVATIGLTLAQLSAAGFPLTAGFPFRLVLLEKLSTQSLTTIFWILIGIFGLLAGAIRTMTNLSTTTENIPWQLNEDIYQTVLIGVGILTLFALGLFPQIVHPFFRYLPVAFEHLGH